MWCVYNGTVNNRTSRTLFAWVAGTGAVLLIVFLGIHITIALSARKYASEAVKRFEGDSVEALIESVDCESCPLPDRTQAVWALGQLGDPRGLPVLRKYSTGATCDHSRAICQREIRKAIRHLETGWGLPTVVRFIARAGTAR